MIVQNGVPITITLDRVIINQLQTHVHGLDEVLGGGLPEYSFNLIAGAPGTGKTTLSQQLMFALATPERPALHFTVVGEPSLKLLRTAVQLLRPRQSRHQRPVRQLESRHTGTGPRHRAGHDRC